MAKKKREDEQEPEVGRETTVEKLSKHLIESFNKGEEEKVAWNLETDFDNPTDVKDFISTGSTLLDYIVSNRRDGGIPMGKLSEISGEEASGKSLVCSQIIANVQRKGGLGVYIDSENAFNPAFARQLGVDVSRMVYLQPGTVEAVFETIEKTILSVRAKDVKKPVVIVWDSVASTPPKAEIEGDYDPNSRIGLQAKAIAKGLRKLTETVGREKITLIFANQLKYKIGFDGYGDPWMTPGGKAIPYHASVRIRLTSNKKLKDEKTEQIYAVNTTAKVMKCRFGPPLRSCKFEIHFSHGVEDVGSWFDFLHEHDEIEKDAGFCYLSSFPSGRIWEKGSKAGVDRGVQFREGDWKELVKGDPKVRAHCLDLLEKHLVVRYDQAPKPAPGISGEPTTEVA